MITSVSLPDDLLRALDKLGKECYAGRSDAVRSGIRMLVQHHTDLSLLKGTVDAVLLVVHRGEANVSAVRHEYADIIKTQLHNHAHRKCFEIFVLYGPATGVRGLVERLRSSRRVENVSFVPL